MKLSCAVMAHPVRRDSAEDLLEALDRDVRISYDSNEVPSKTPAQRWANGRRAWEMHDRSADYHMVIQDDVLVSKDLLAGLEAALDELGPQALMSAYTGEPKPSHGRLKRELERADSVGDAWAATQSLYWGPAIIAPVNTIRGMLQWCSRPARMAFPYDFNIGVYFRDRLKWRTHFPARSLVEHRGLPSLVGNDVEFERVAHNFHTGSALDIDWTKHSAPLQSRL